MDDTHLKLVALHRAEFDRAKKADGYVAIAQISIAVLSLLSVFTTDTMPTYLLTLGSLFSACLVVFFSQKAKRHKRVAERGRRLLLMASGLDYTISEVEMADLLTSFSVSEQDAKQWEDSNYFESNEKPGNERFCSMIQESAFFSENLFKLSARRTWLISSISLAASVLILFLLPIVNETTWSIEVAKTLAVLLMFLVTINVMDNALDFSESANTINRIRHRLQAIRRTQLSSNDLAIVFTDYNTAVEAAPLVPSSVYDKNKDHLTRLWSEVQAVRR